MLALVIVGLMYAACRLMTGTVAPRDCADDPWFE